MDIMVILQIIVLLGAIFVGVRLGGIGIGYAGGAGVLILGLCLGMKPGNIPWDVILIIASVISAISAMQLAGGLDYLVYIAEKILYKNPKYINYLAPLVTYVLTIFAGTGHTAFYCFSGFRCRYLHDRRSRTVRLELSDSDRCLACYHFPRLHGHRFHHDDVLQDGPQHLSGLSGTS